MGGVEIWFPTVTDANPPLSISAVIGVDIENQQPSFPLGLSEEIIAQHPSWECQHTRKKHLTYRYHMQLLCQRHSVSS